MIDLKIMNKILSDERTNETVEKTVFIFFCKFGILQLYIIIMNEWCKYHQLYLKQKSTDGRG